MPLQDIEPYLLSLLNLDRLSSDEQLVDYLNQAVSRCRLRMHTETKLSQRAKEVESIGVVPSIAKVLLSSQLPPASTDKEVRRTNTNQA